MTSRAKLSIIFIIAFLIRLAFNFVFQGINSPPDPDAGVDPINYESVARSLYNGEGYNLYGGVNTTMPPGTPFIIYLIYNMFGINYAAIRIAFCLFGAATCVGIYFLGRDLAGERVGLCAALALALYPMHIQFSQHFFSEAPWGFFVVIAVLFATKYQKTGQVKFASLFGMFLGIAAYIRQVSMLYFLVLVVLLLLFRRLFDRKMLIAYLLVPAVVIILVISPWIARNFIVTKHFIPMTTHGGLTFWDGNNDTKFLVGGNMGSGETDVAANAEFQSLRKISSPIERDRMAYRIAWETIKRHISEIPKLEMMKMYRLITPFYETGNMMYNIVGGFSWAILFPFSVLGMVSVARDTRYLPMHAMVIMTVIITLVWFGSCRYREAIGPFLVLYGAIGFYFLLDKIKEKKAIA